MKRLERLGEAIAPDGTRLMLYRRDGACAIRVGGVELMSTRRSRSEEQLAELVCRPLQHSRGSRVLIGGLGFGFTLWAALRGAGLSVQVTRVRAHASSGASEALPFRRRRGIRRGREFGDGFGRRTLGRLGARLRDESVPVPSTRDRNLQ